MRTFRLFVLALACFVPPEALAGADEVRSLVFPSLQIDALRARGAGVMDELVELYNRSDLDQRTEIAGAFYQLGIESRAAKAALWPDLHTEHERLRLAAQWAIGRVSGDDDVVDALVDNMRRDANALFRDKAACALAHDQMHLNARQKARMFELLIMSLRSTNPQVRDLSIRVLEIHLGQRKGFRPNGAPEEREAAVQAWLTWLNAHRAEL
jgi:hypothetical protein